MVGPVTSASMEYKHLKLSSGSKEWIQYCSNKMGRIAKGVRQHMLMGSNTIHFINPYDKPTNRSATYLRIMCEKKPHKEEKFRVRITVGVIALITKASLPLPL